MSSLRKRARELGIIPGSLPTGPLNAITDVAGVCVGHHTLFEGTDIRTGVTAILPHGGNLFQDKVPAGLAVGNGFGKLIGSTQVIELGEIETPVLLTNTLAVPRAADALITWTLRQPGNESVQSVNPVVGETNDGWLSDIRRRSVTVEHCLSALEAAQPGPVREGCVGSGTGTVAFGWKGGVGSSSRRLPQAQGGWTLGVLVQSNFGGELHLPGSGQRDSLPDLPPGSPLASPQTGESILIVVATNAPLSDRNLRRLAVRALGGLARSGASLSNNSGDYALAFSTHPGVRRTPQRRSQPGTMDELPNDLCSPLFLAAIDATEEAIYNSLFMAETTTGYEGHTAHALPYPE
jgi:D-aminopeptidase